ncbi:MAG: YraN family protein [Microcystaceae cyanobacterium]
MTQLGQLGEEIVAAWLTSQGWKIIHRQWHCRWGEIDIIACMSHSIIFVEVKTRSQGNWDLNGLLAVNPKKQGKILTTAQSFLAEFPQLAEYYCRFDVALVQGKKLSQINSTQDRLSSIKLNQPINYQGYQLTLISYLEDAFSE